MNPWSRVELGVLEIDVSVLRLRCFFLFLFFAVEENHWKTEPLGFQPKT